MNTNKWHLHAERAKGKEEHIEKKDIDCSSHKEARLLRKHLEALDFECEITPISKLQNL